jgi:hypothetical protein
MAMETTSVVTNISDFEEVAKSKLPKMIYDYYACGVEDEWSLKENRNAFERIRSVSPVLEKYRACHIYDSNTICAGVSSSEKPQLQQRAVSSMSLIHRNFKFKGVRGRNIQ